MKLKNKKTGEIAEASVLNFELVVRYDDGRVEKYPLLFDYSNFEYYEEPKEWWYIDIHGPHKVNSDDEYYQQVKAASKEIGNYFSSQEEAELAVRKLKAFKRLKDEGLRFDDWHYRNCSISGIAIGINASFDASKMDILHSNYIEDLTTCFGKML